MKMLALRDVTLGYGKKVVVNKVDFELQAREFVGANGASNNVATNIALAIREVVSRVL